MAHAAWLEVLGGGARGALPFATVLVRGVYSDERHSAVDNYGQSTTWVFGSCGRGARSSLVLGTRQNIPSVACGSPRTAPVRYNKIARRTHW